MNRNPTIIRSLYIGFLCFIILLTILLNCNNFIINVKSVKSAFISQNL